MIDAAKALAYLVESGCTLGIILGALLAANLAFGVALNLLGIYLRIWKWRTGTQHRSSRIFNVGLVVSVPMLLLLVVGSYFWASSMNLIYA